LWQLLAARPSKKVPIRDQAAAINDGWFALRANGGSLL
jgi:hypothetical protein